MDLNDLRFDCRARDNVRKCCNRREHIVECAAGCSISFQNSLPALGRKTLLNFITNSAKEKFILNRKAVTLVNMQHYNLFTHPTETFYCFHVSYFPHRTGFFMLHPWYISSHSLKCQTEFNAVPICMYKKPVVFLRILRCLFR